MPKFAGTAQAVIENIWATAAVAYSGAEGREQRGLVRACSRGEMLCAKAALLNAQLGEGTEDRNGRFCPSVASLMNAGDRSSTALGSGVAETFISTARQVCARVRRCGWSPLLASSCCPSLGAKLLLELGAREQEVDWRGGRIGRPFPVQTDLSLFPPLPVPSVWKQDKMSRTS